MKPTIDIPKVPNLDDLQNQKNSFIAKIKEIFVSPLSAFIFCAALVCQVFFPWWTLAIAAFVGSAIFATSSGEAFAKSTAAISVLWLLMAWYYHFTTGGILSNKIAQILPVGNATGLIAATTFIGGLVAGWAGMAGYLVRRLF
jgi:hypothetical protein